MLRSIQGHDSGGGWSTWVLLKLPLVAPFCTAAASVIQGPQPSACACGAQPSLSHGIVRGAMGSEWTLRLHQLANLGVKQHQVVTILRLPNIRTLGSGYMVWCWWLSSLNLTFEALPEISVHPFGPTQVICLLAPADRGDG